jgi:hypothetical protein
MSNNESVKTPTALQMAEAFAKANYGEPKQWTPVSGITEERLFLNIQDSFLAGYNSRDEEVNELLDALDLAIVQLQGPSNEISRAEFKQLQDTFNKYNKES